jgi:hypothetical protein
MPLNKGNSWTVSPSARFVGSYLYFFIILSGVRLSPLGTAATTGLLYQPRMIDDECGAVGRIRIGKGNQSTRRKFDPVPFCPPQMLHVPTWARTRAAAVGSQ